MKRRFEPVDLSFIALMSRSNLSNIRSFMHHTDSNIRDQCLTEINQ